VDDGAQTLEQALAMGRIAAADGCTALVATPHQRRDEWSNDDARRLADRLAELAAQLPQDAQGSVPRLHLGGEVRVDSELLADLARPGRSGVLSLAGSRYLLLEFEPSGFGPTRSTCARAARRGLRPIVAHPEVVRLLGERRRPALSSHRGRSALPGDGHERRESSARGRKAGSGAAARRLRAVRRQRRPPPGLAAARALGGAQGSARELGEATAAALTEIHPLAVVENRPLTGLSDTPALRAAPGAAR
jgi:hypothetical protein